MYLLLNMFIFQPAMLVFWRISFQINSERKRPMIVRVSMHSYSVARGYAFELLILHLVASYSQITPIRTATYQRNELNKWVIQKWINSQQFQRERVWLVNGFKQFEANFKISKSGILDFENVESATIEFLNNVGMQGKKQGR